MLDSIEIIIAIDVAPAIPYAAKEFKLFVAKTTGVNLTIQEEYHPEDGSGNSFGLTPQAIRSKLWLRSVIIFALIFAAYLAKETLFYIKGNQLDSYSGTPGSEEWEGLVFGTPAMAVIVYIYVYLAVAAIRANQKAPDPVLKRGFRFIALGGICSITGLSLVGINAILWMTPTFGDFAPIVKMLMYSLVLDAMSFVYYEFMLPMKNKKREN